MYFPRPMLGEKYKGEKERLCQKYEMTNLALKL